jgi:hypothetical protein
MEIYTVMIHGMLRDYVLFTDHEATIKKAVAGLRDIIVDQRIEVVSLRRDYETVSGLLVKAREQIAALTEENKGLRETSENLYEWLLESSSASIDDIPDKIYIPFEATLNGEKDNYLDPHHYGVISVNEDLCYLPGAIEFIKKYAGPHDDMACECNTLAGIADKIEVAISGEKDRTDPRIAKLAFKAVYADKLNGEKEASDDKF